MLKEICQADVIVAGGGVAGFAAAVASARQGADTVLVEKNGIPGGVATSCLMMSIGNHLCTGDDRLVVRGIAEELIDRVAEAGGTAPAWRSSKNHHITFDIEVMIPVMLKMLQESGVRVLIHTLVTELVTANSLIRGLVVQHKSGTYLLTAKTFIDATGDGTLACLAGEPNILKDAGGSLLFVMGNVDLDQLYLFFKENPLEYPVHMDHDSTFSEFEKNWLDRGILHLPHGGGKKYSFVQNEIARGLFSPQSGKVFGMDALGFFGLRKNRTCLINSDFFSVNSADPWAMSAVELEVRGKIDYIANFVKKCVPGFKNAYVSTSAAESGIRSSRNIETMYDFTSENKGSAVIFDDTIGAGPAIKWIESEVQAGDLLGQKQKLKGQLKMPYVYEIPYRTILPKLTRNLLVVSGKSISHAVLRQMASCMVLGQAGGVASALMARTGTGNADLDIQLLQKHLIGQKVYLGDRDSLR
jgi:hypothetical protein